MKSTTEFIPVNKTKLVGVTKNEKDTPKQHCRFKLMAHKNAPNFERILG